MKVDSNKLGSKINSVCWDCGHAALELPINKIKKNFLISTYHKGKCDVCKQDKSVTEPRDFGYPIFEVME